MASPNVRRDLQTEGHSKARGREISGDHDIRLHRRTLVTLMLRQGFVAASEKPLITDEARGQYVSVSVCVSDRSPINMRPQNWAHIA